MRLVNLEGASERGPSRDDYEEDDEQLDYAEQVLQPQAPLQRQTVDQESRRDARKSNATLIPPVHLDLRSVQDVLAKDDRVGSSPAKQEHIARVEAGSQEPRFAIDVLEVVLLAAVPRDGRSELEVDGHTSSSDQHAGNPDEEREADTAGQGEDGAGSRKNTGADHAVEDEEDGGGDADLAFGLANLVQGACAVVSHVPKRPLEQLCLPLSRSTAAVSWCFESSDGATEVPRNLVMNFDMVADERTSEHDWHGQDHEEACALTLWRKAREHDGSLPRSRPVMARSMPTSRHLPLPPKSCNMPPPTTLLRLIRRASRVKPGTSATMLHYAPPLTGPRTAVAGKGDVLRKNLSQACDGVVDVIDVGNFERALVRLSDGCPLDAIAREGPNTPNEVDYACIGDCFVENLSHHTSLTTMWRFAR